MARGRLLPRAPTVRTVRTNWQRLAHDARRMAQALERLGVRAGRSRRDAGDEPRPASRRMVRRRRHGRRSAHRSIPRLFDEQLDYIMDHAEDHVLLYDAAFEPLVERLKPRAATGRTLHSASTMSSTTGSAPRTATIAGTRATSANRAGCATPAARRAIPRAFSTNIARPCFTPCRSSLPMSSTCRQAR